MRRRQQSAQGMLEYALAVSLIAVVVIGIVTIIGRNTNSALCSSSQGLDSRTICSNLLSADAGTMENGLGGWVANTNTTAAQGTAQAYEGTHSLALTAAATGQISAFNPGPVLVPGAIYVLNAYFRAATIGRSVFVQVDWNNTHGSAASAMATDTTTGWTSASMAVVVPADQANSAVTVEVVVSSAAGSETHNVDHITLVAGKTANLLNAESADFEGGIGSWATTIDNWLNPDSTVSRDTTNAYSGSGSLRVATGGTMAYSGAGIPRVRVPLTTGITYTLSARITCASTVVAPTWNLGMVGANNAMPVAGVSTFSCDGTWRLVKVSYAAAAPDLWFEPFVRTGSAAEQVTFNMDEVMLTPGLSTTWQPGYTP